MGIDIGREVGDLGEVIRARKPRRLPVVMTREETRAVLASLSGDKWLMASLMVGAGLRLVECLGLRVQDVDFARKEVLVRDGKGAKDSMTMLPDALKAPLQEHLKKVKAIHERDLADGWGRVSLPDALDRKYPNAPKDWRWQWVFPQANRWKNTRTGEQGRHHAHETILQRAVKEAVREPASSSMPVVTPPGIPSRRICLRPATTSAPSGSCLATRTSAQRCSTPMS